ncbi:MAG: DUF502 domain-containing protein [Alicyclobacillus sp.]|nr:DUF502 domain-containing protein [Alicyclobacillus sp.]
MAILRQLAKHFGVGLVTVLPFALVIWVVVSVFNVVDGWFGPFFDWLVGKTYPGAGFLFILVMITLVGVLMRLYISHKVVSAMDALFKRIPFIKSLYSMVKEIVDNLLGRRRRGFQRTVLVAWPDERALVVGFVTNEQLPESLDPDGSKIAVYIPNAFQFAGITAIVDRDRTQPCDLTIEQALKFTLSAGLGSSETDHPADAVERRGAPQEPAPPALAQAGEPRGAGLE